jgi:paraquat-inducible protein B
VNSDAGLPPADLLPAPRVLRRRWIPSLIWLVPAVAVVIGLSLVVNAWVTAGPRVTISFQTAQGLEVGKTLVKHRSVTIGHVTAISLSNDGNRVRVSAELLKSARSLLTSDAQFWVVRPRVGIGWASGLDTLLSGSYIAVEAGDASTRQTEFVGVENPPPLTHGVLGKSVLLHAADIGSLALGAPVYFRHFEVGHVIDRKIDAGGNGARVVLFIDAPYDALVTRATRFWNAGGIDLSLRADGLKLRTQSLASVLAGGVAFDGAPDAPDAGPIASGAEFTLFDDQEAAMAPPAGDPRYVRMRFEQSVRGLSVGAPVEFVGVTVGQVFAVDLDYDQEHKTFPVIVTARIYPRRMGRAYVLLEQNGTATNEEKTARLVEQLVARGLRAQPRTGNLLTGQLYIALDFIPGARPVRFAANAQTLEIPTVPGGTQELQQKLAAVVAKIDRLPIEEIGQQLHTDLVDLDRTLGDFRTQALPAGTASLQSLRTTLDRVNETLADDASWRERVDQTLDEARRSLQSLRSLTDYLDRHPEAVLRGRHPSQPSVGEKSAPVASGPQ